MDQQAHDDPDEQRWLRMLHALFVVALLVPTAYAVVDGGPGLGTTLALVGVFAVWYALALAWAPFGRSLLPASVYTGGAIALLTLLVLRDEVFLLISYALIPQLFSLLPRWAAIVATAAMVGIAPLLQGEFGRGDVLTVVAIVALGLVITAIVQGLDQRNAEQRAVIAELEAARAENERLADEATVQGRHAGMLAERQRLAHEIHDTLAQGFTSIVTQLEAAEQATVAGEGDLAARRIEQAKRTAREGLTEARRTVEALRPASLDEVDLPEALRALASRQHEDLPAVFDIEVIVDGPTVAVADDVEAALLRVVQEALANVARHARASSVTITLSYLDDLLLLDVQDDGVGFDPAARHGERTGYGLTSMRERVALVGGRLTVEAVPGDGTTIAARVPLRTVRPPTPERSRAAASAVQGGRE